VYKNVKYRKVIFGTNPVQIALGAKCPLGTSTFLYSAYLQVKMDDKLYMTDDGLATTGKFDSPLVALLLTKYSFCTRSGSHA
jgi:hypothetical protein